MICAEYPDQMKPQLGQGTVQKPADFAPGEPFASTHNGIRMVSTERLAGTAF